ncbi:MAG: hypothetical protein M0031_00280 [Thermaerobacter sp.]|nr:hypothetical protein [Thermaerobacter sp.]
MSGMEHVKSWIAARGKAKVAAGVVAGVLVAAGIAAALALSSSRNLREAVPSSEGKASSTISPKAKTGCGRTAAGIMDANGRPYRGLHFAPVAVAMDTYGNIYILSAQIWVLSARNETLFGIRLRQSHIYSLVASPPYPAHYEPPAPLGYVHSGHPAELFPGGNISQLAVGPNSGVFFTAGWNGGSSIFLLASRNETRFGKRMQAGHIYPVVGNGKPGWWRFGGNGGPATKAGLGDPAGMAVDSRGNLYIAQMGGPGAVWVVAAHNEQLFGKAMKQGNIYLIAGGLASPQSGKPYSSIRSGIPGTAAFTGPASDVAVDSSSNAYMDASRMIAAQKESMWGFKMKAGDIYTIAHGHAGGRFIALGAHRNIFVANYFRNNMVQMIANYSETRFGIRMKAGHVYTVAGNTARGCTGNGGPATEAELNKPASLALGKHGNLYIADEGNGVVQVVAARNETRFGIPMKTGCLYTIVAQRKQ